MKKNRPDEQTRLKISRQRKIIPFTRYFKGFKDRRTPSVAMRNLISTYQLFLDGRTRCKVFNVLVKNRKGTPVVAQV